MRILTRYLIKESLFPFFVSLGLVTFLMLMNRLITLVDLVLKHGVPFFTVGRLLIYILPATFAITIPMSLLVAALLALGRLSADLELTALKSGGVSPGALAKPLLGLGLFFSLGMAVFNEVALPQANASYKSLFYEIISQRSGVALVEGAFVSDFEGVILKVGKRAPKSERLEDVTVIKPGKANEPTQWVQARWGRVVSDRDSLSVSLELHEGEAQFINASGQPIFTTLDFERSRVNLDIGGALRAMQGEDRQPQEMSVRELLARLKAMPAQDARLPHFKTEMHKKIAIPFACLVFMLLACGLGLLAKRGSRIVNFIFALGLIFIYYLLLSLGQTYGDSGRMAGWAAMWMPNVALTFLGLIALRLSGGLRFAVIRIPIERNLGGKGPKSGPASLGKKSLGARGPA